MAVMAGGALLLCLTVGGVLAIPGILEERKWGNESAAIGALKTIGTAQSVYREADKEGDGNLDYATLDELGMVGGIPLELASGTREGYIFEASYGASTSEFIWFATARPIEPGVTGDRYFASNHEGVTYYTTQEAFKLNTLECTMPDSHVHPI